MFPVFGMFLLVQALYIPHYSDIRYTYDGKNVEQKYLPIAIPRGRSGMLEAWITLHSYPFQPRVLHILGDDCLSKLEINGNNIPLPAGCAYPVLIGGNLFLDPYLRAGKNKIHVEVSDTHGGQIGFRIDTSPGDLILIALRAILRVLILGWLLSIFHRTILRRSSALTVLLGGAFALRVMYVSVTSYLIRSHDAPDHALYIEYVLHHWTLPPAAGAWEYHQAPLYYFLMAAVMRASVLVHHTLSGALGAVQQWSLFLSGCTLGAAAWVGEELFGTRVDRRHVLFLATIAFFPVLILFSSRINNDVLYQTVAFLFLGCLLSWWNKGDRKWLLITSIAIALGFLTKANAYLFAPILWICIVLRPGLRRKKKIAWIALSAAVVLALTGWLLILRYLENDYGRLFAPGDGMNPAFALKTSLVSFLVFHPADILELPFANAASGREWFWMFFFKTALFGEFSYRPDLFLPARILAVLGMGSVLIAFAGWIRMVQKRDMFLIPLTVTFLIILAGALLYRMLHPSVPNQDFRFSILLIPILAATAVFAADVSGWTGKLARAWLLAFACVCAWFFLTLVATA